MLPDDKTLKHSILQCAVAEVSIKDVAAKLADQFGLTSEERSELLLSGDLKFNKRVAWAKTHLTRDGLVEISRRGYFRITERGREVLGAK